MRVLQTAAPFSSFASLSLSLSDSHPRLPHLALSSLISLAYVLHVRVRPIRSPARAADGAYYQEGSISIALEYMDLGGLDSALPKKPSKVPEPALAHMLFQVLWGLSYLKHEHKLHRTSAVLVFTLWCGLPSVVEGAPPPLR